MLLTNNSEDDINVGLRAAISRLCKKGLKFNSELAITGLLAITIDGQEVFLVNIHEVVVDEGDDEIETNDVASNSSQNGLTGKEPNLIIIDTPTSDQLQFSQTSESGVFLNKSTNSTALKKSTDDINLTISKSNRDRSFTVSKCRRLSAKSRPHKSSSSDPVLGQQTLDQGVFDNRLSEKLLCLPQQRLSEKRLSFDESSEQRLSRNNTRSNSPVDLVLPSTPVCVKLEPTDQESDDAFITTHQQPDEQLRFDMTQQYDYTEFLPFPGIPHSKISYSTTTNEWMRGRSPYHRQNRSLLPSSSSKISSTESHSFDAVVDTTVNASLAAYGFPSSGLKFPIYRDSKPAKMNGGEGIFCNNCGTSKTTTWRRCPEDRTLLCNACGCYYKIHQAKLYKRYSQIICFLVSSPFCHSNIKIEARMAAYNICYQHGQFIVPSQWYEKLYEVDAGGKTHFILKASVRS